MKRMAEIIGVFILRGLIIWGNFCYSRGFEFDLNFEIIKKQII